MTPAQLRQASLLMNNLTILQRRFPERIYWLGLKARCRRVLPGLPIVLPARSDHAVIV
jgi:hypothetical protein